MKKKLVKLVSKKMLTNKIKFFLIFIFFGKLLAIEYKELIEKLAQVDQQINKIRSEYTQLINFVDLNEVYELKAKFVFVKPDKLKVEVYDPVKQIIIADTKNNNQQ